VDIDLANHVIDGGITVGAGGPTGILNLDGYDDLTVRNGSIALFGFGIRSDDASRTRVVDVSISAAGTGITFEGAGDHEVRNSGVFGRTWGITVAGSQRLVVAGSDFEGFLGGGLTAIGDFARIVRNRVINRAPRVPRGARHRGASVRHAPRGQHGQRQRRPRHRGRGGCDRPRRQHGHAERQPASVH
jgi:hypothetical protein